ncbi:cystathionine beta-lyase, chloroplastic-like, partial [Tripterygium wilfordii]|uniref:cystathionine beta-lyase, chloroplastic-like n=1 Tax=Tripterygium wilfordii TaxID=458696 RepID=UPI0018F85732
CVHLGLPLSAWRCYVFDLRVGGVTVATAINTRTKLVWLESPTNPRQQISDIRRIVEMAHSCGALVLVDNSIMSPVLSQPLELGADIVMHSATKFIAGHSDVMAGVLAVKGERTDLRQHKLFFCNGTACEDLLFFVFETVLFEMVFVQRYLNFNKVFIFLLYLMLLTAVSRWDRVNKNVSPANTQPLHLLASFDCWLCLRGIKTMALRVEKQQEDAQKIAEFLIIHVGEGKHKIDVLKAKASTVAGPPVETTLAMLETYSSVKSLISLPCFMSHASIPAAVREARGLTEDLIRISVGIEDVHDLIADLDYALRTGPL